MKKALSLVLALVLMLSMATVVSAENTTTLTTTVPAATYTLNIPADQEIPFGATSTDIGYVSVTNATGFAVGKNLNVTLTYDSFKCEGVSTTIPFTVGYTATPDSNERPVMTKDVASGSFVTFEGKSNGGVQEYLTLYDGENQRDCDQFVIEMLSSDWGMALAGDYSATITFTAEVVVSQ